MTGVEIDMIVADSLETIALYERVFPVQRIETTACEKGNNEAVFSIFGTRFHLLDANPDYGMTAPNPEQPLPMWFNVTVEDIRVTHGQALAEGFKEIQPVTEMEAMGVMNSMISDPFGYVWMLHEVVREVSFAERCRIMEEQMARNSQ